MSNNTLWGGLGIVSILLVALVATASVNTNTILTTGHSVWDQVHLEVLSWDGPQETLTTTSGTTVILQREPEDEIGPRKTKKVLDSALQRASYWGPIEKPVTLRLYSNALMLKWFDSDFLMQPAGRAFNDLVFIVSPGSASYPRYMDDGRLEDLLTHELTHTWLFQSVGGHGPVFTSIPAWFVEGMAEHTEFPDSGQNVLDIQRKVGGDPTKLINGWLAFYTLDPESAYLSSRVIFGELVKLGGREGVVELVEMMGQGMGFDTAFELTYGLSPDAFVSNWWERSPYFYRLWADYPVTQPITEDRRDEICGLMPPNNVQVYVARDPCNDAFERFHACPEDLPGLCISEFELVMHRLESVTVASLDTDSHIVPTWATDCDCMDEGPTR